MKTLKVVLALMLAGLGFASAEAQKVALLGTVVTPQKVLKSGRIVIDGKTIVCVGSRCSTKGAVVVKTGLDLFAGFVDSHNHVSWNFLPFTRFSKPTYNNRYNWRFGEPVFTAAQRAKSAVEKAVKCDITRYGEIMAALGGTTTIVSEDKCFGDGIRNGESPDLGGPWMRTVGDPLQLRGASRTYWDQALAQTSALSGRFVIHLSEGKGASALAELTKLDAMGPQYAQNHVTSIVHGLPYGPAEMTKLAQRGWSLIWSPSSNMRLYQATTNVLAAMQAGVNVAIAPDWNIGGSPTLLQELAYVRALYPSGPVRDALTGARLLHMSTYGAAAAIGLEKHIGALAPGFHADIVGIRRRAGVTNPLDNLTASDPRSVELVLVDGKVIVKNPANTALATVPTAGACEAVDACGVQRAVCASFSVSQVAARIRAAYPSASPLADCSPRPLQ
jgi:cytosine/adenosine deaminase-related metal-dependent hydrolase